MLTVDASKSRVRVETETSGLLASIAHDLRIEAPICEGRSSDGESCVVRFRVDGMKVVESRRHKTGAWHGPSPSDAKDIEGRIQKELFDGCSIVSVDGRLRGDHATLSVRAQREQTVQTPIRVERTAAGARATGTCELSLRALGTGKVRVPLGAIKLVDKVSITFDVVFVEAST
jgi:hypothetical protein